MVKTKNQILEEKLKQQLDLKYSAASKLLKEARQNLEIGPDEELDRAREEELLDEAIIIYEDDLTPEEQEAMKQGSPSTMTSGGSPGDGNGGEVVEAEWRRKARLAAERREQEWEEQQKQQQEAKAASAVPAAPTKEEQFPEGEGEEYDPEMQPVVTRVTRKTITKGKVSNKKPGVVATCYCVIM